MTESMIIKFKKSPSFSFRSKHKNISQSSLEYLPPPNLYNPQKPMRKQPQVKFSRALRISNFDKKTNQIPGPGSYDKKQKDNFQSFQVQKDRKMKTFSQRFRQKFNQVPGPGAYAVNKDLKKTLPVFSIRGKYKTYEQIQRENNKYKPSPSAYDLNKSLIKNASIISIPKSERMKSIESRSPGPGQYQFDEKIFSSQKSFGKRTFSNSNRQINFQLESSSPGPGKYLKQSTFQMNKNKKKGFTYGKSMQNPEKQRSPGPAKYEAKPNFKFRSIESCNLTQALRKTFSQIDKSDLPGPGQYDNLNSSYSKLKFKSLSASKFSKAQLSSLSPIKSKLIDKFYDAQLESIKRSSHSFSIGQQKKSSPFERNLKKLPGPGQYNPQQKITKESILSTKFSNSSRSGLQSNKLTPGPGSYNKNDNNLANKMGPKFSKSKRITDFISIDTNRTSALRMSQHTYVNNQSNINNQQNYLKKQ